MADITDAEIRAIVDNFLAVVGSTQYVGARYVPTIGRLGEDTWQWDGGIAPYEPLTIVQWEGDSYTSRKDVPIGVNILNEEYWANTGNFNGQLAQVYRRLRNLEESTNYQPQIDALSDALDSEEEARISADETLQGNIDAEELARIDAVSDEEEARIAADGTLQENIDAEERARIAADGTLQDNIDAEALARSGADTALGSRIRTVEDTSRAAIMGHYIAPTYVGDFMENLQFGCCCRKDDNMYTFNPTNYDNLGVVRIFDMENNILLNTVNDVVMGHGNSCCWDSVRERFWIAPMSTYNQGVATHTNELYYTNSTISIFGTHELPINDFPHGVSFDATTNTLFAIFAHNDELLDPDTIRVYAMGEEDTEFSLYKEIVSEEFVPRTAAIIWQDFAVYDDVLVACRTDGTCYVIPLYEETARIAQTFHIGEIDAGGLWSYGEVEGIEFDAEGRLYNARNATINTTNSGARYQINSCFVTELNTAHRITPNPMYRQNQYYTVTIDTSNTFAVSDRWHVHSINQLMWRLDRFGKVNVASGTTYNDGIVRICDRSIKLDVLGTMNVDRIILDSGMLFIIVQGGSLNIANSDSQAAIDANSTASQIYFRSVGGHLTYNTNAEFINFGYGPSIFCCNGLDNIDSIEVEGVTVSGPRMLMGNRTVYQPA